ncbi:hypothetical protein CAEBREN_32440 [Caenorhabditis brenneri]|uniref:Serpentine Receptor, class H n=1 Tax=Caenorhabditis brenneri TaxID=135651 RepID=G0NHM5_CAEBE|nr:hypothetical protein CAEBREN_32440 [Caenorhabditis brenneri]
MSSVKGLLMLLHSLCFSFDVITTLFAVPYAMFPAMAGYGLGFIDSPGLFLYLMVTVITATSTTVFVIFENRFFILFAENSWWKHVRKYFIAISYAMVPLYFLPAQFFIPEQEPARKVVWESLECHPELPSHRDLFVLSTDFKIPGYSVLVAESVPAIQIAIFTSLNNYNLQYAKPSSNISVKTMRMQRRLAYCITIQVVQIIPVHFKTFFMFQCFVIVLLFAVPINVVVYVIKYWYHSQAVNNLVFFCLSTHGTAATLLMIFIHKPYRDFVFTPFNRVIPQKATTVLVPTFVPVSD